MVRTLSAFLLVLFAPPAWALDAPADGCNSFWREIEYQCKISPSPSEARCDPVHERATRAIVAAAFGRSASIDDPVVREYVIGDRWTDDPEALLSGNDSTWCQRFLAAQKHAQSESLFDRTMFGDLQFVHGMASRVGEPAGATARNIDRWFEFLYRVGIGDIRGDVRLAAVPVEGFAAFFPRSTLTVSDLFHAGAPDANAAFRALGSALHLIEDMTGSGHVVWRAVDSRASLVVVNYLTRSVLHRKDIGWREMGESGESLERLGRMPAAMQHGVDLIRLAKRRTPWAQVKLMFDSYFLELSDLKAPAAVPP